MKSEKPKSLDELYTLIDSGDISVMLSGEEKTGLRFLVCDNRRCYDEGEVYELWFPK